ncbi:hypothetical protein KQI86_19920 [Clostridium sp. MSJ-11]|uniref:DNA-binding protein n=1 Tax=Clostridium mobile TaxID=2841512 RepID=A0ABS6EMT9_9CLOT|nr:hypothetical protein [Clostridium mobile]MBU5486555.1 hypothetical protein [Clostridium mobile]
MNKEEFNSLSVFDQVKTFNELLEGSSIRKVCGEIGISKTTVRDRFKKNGYVFDSSSNKYINLGGHEEDKKKEIISNNKITLVNKKEKEISYKSNLEQMYNEIYELIELKDDLKNLIKKEKLRENIIEIQELKIRNFEGDLKVKSIKVYDEVLELFNAFVDNHKEFKQQDIVSQAFWEFLNKYK